VGLGLEGTTEFVSSPSVQSSPQPPLPPSSVLPPRPPPMPPTSGGDDTADGQIRPLNPRAKPPKSSDAAA